LDAAQEKRPGLFERSEFPGLTLLRVAPSACPHKAGFNESCSVEIAAAVPQRFTKVLRDVILPRVRAKITSHFYACILPGGVAKAQKYLDIPVLWRLARQAPQRQKM
jgi:hypothetical protein